MIWVYPRCFLAVHNVPQRLKQIKLYTRKTRFMSYLSACYYCVWSGVEWQVYTQSCLASLCACLSGYVSWNLNVSFNVYACVRTSFEFTKCHVQNMKPNGQYFVWISCLNELKHELNVSKFSESLAHYWCTCITSSLLTLLCIQIHN